MNEYCYKNCPHLDENQLWCMKYACDLYIDNEYILRNGECLDDFTGE